MTSNERLATGCQMLSYVDQTSRATWQYVLAILLFTADRENTGVLRLWITLTN